jgi:hypothetical protein
MAKINLDGKTIKDFISEEWKSHKKNMIFDYGIIIDNIQYFIAINKNSLPIKYNLLLLKPDGDLMGFNSTISEKEIDDLKRYINKLYLNENIKKITFSEVIDTFSLGKEKNKIAETSVDYFYEKIGDKKITSRLPKNDLIESEKKRLLDSGFDNILKSLNQEVLEILSVAEDVQFRDYKFYNEAGDKGLYRRQAGKLYPLLAVLLSRRPSLKMAIDNQKPLVDAISNAFGEEDGKPRVNKTTINKIRNISWNASHIKIDFLLKQLAEIPPDWFPKNEEDWNAFCDLTETVGTILAGGKIGLPLVDLYASSQGKWKEFMERSCKSFLDTRPPEGTDEEITEQLKKYIDFKAIRETPKDKVDAFIYDMIDSMPYNPPGVNKNDISEWLISLNNPYFDKDFLKAACLSVEDVSEAFAKKVLMPLASLEAKVNDSYLSETFYDISVNAAAKILFSGKNLQNIFENSRGIHNRLNVIMIAGTDEDVGEYDNAVEINLKRQKKQKEAETKILNDLDLDINVDEATSWAPLTTIVQAPNGVWIVPLRTPEDLKKEGKLLSHCVAGYSTSCQKAGHHIISMRIKEGNSVKRLSTAELSPVIKGKNLSTRQHRAKSNGNPPKEALDAYNWYLNQLTNDLIPINFEGIKNYLSNQKLGLDDIEKMCDYNWRFKELIEKAMTPWGKSVGKKYRSMKIDEFAKDSVVRDVINVLSPELKFRKSL